MKNPFIQMAAIAAAMAAAFQEQTLREAGSLLPSRPRRNARGPAGHRNPAGTKIARKFYRNFHGRKGSREEAVEWRNQLHGRWL